MCTHKPKDTHSNAKKITPTIGVTGPRDRTEHASCVTHVPTGPRGRSQGSKSKLAKESQFRQFTQQGHKFAKLCESKWLGEQVRRVCLAGNPLEVNDTTKSQITDEFGSSKNMFGFLEGNGVERKVDDALVVRPWPCESDREARDGGREGGHGRTRLP